MTEETSSIPPIVVAIGPGEMESALEWAAAEAVRAGCGLHLVHAVPVVPIRPETVLVPSSSPARRNGPPTSSGAPCR